MNILENLRSFGLYRLSHQHQLLLQACILSERVVLESWSEWSSLVDIDHLDNASNSLLCQLYYNLSANQIEDSRLSRLKGVYKQNWYNNQLLLKKLQTVVRALQESQIDTLAIENTALVVGYCQDLAQVKLGELNLLIRQENASKAIATLKELSWTQTNPSLSIVSDDDLSLQFQDRFGTCLNLQAHLFWGVPQEHTDKEIWHNSRDCSLGNIDTLVLSSTDLLLNIAMRTFSLGQTSTASLLVNAMLLLQHNSEPVDWIRLVNQGQKYQAILPLRNMLVTLQRLFALSFPDWILPALWQMPIANQEFLQYQVLSGNKKAVVRSILWRMASAGKVIK